MKKFLPFLLLISFAQASTYLFEAEYEGKTFHLFGSQHACPFRLLPEPIQAILLNHDVLITENIEATATLTKERLQKMGVLRQHKEQDYFNTLTEEERAELAKYIEPFLAYKEAEVTINELNLKGLYQAYIAGHFIEGIDYTLMQHYKQTRKPIFGLEDLEAVSQYFESPDLENLKGIIAAKAGFGSELDTILTAEYLEATKLEACPEPEAEVTIRNKSWLPKLLQYHQTYGDKAICCVGFEHLLGHYGLLRLLADQGFKLKRANRDGEFVNFSMES